MPDINMKINRRDDEWRKQSAAQSGILRAKKRREAMEKRRAEPETPQCKHKGWVVRDVQGDNRYLCKECNARFPRHPQMTRSEPEVPVIPDHVLDAMTEFRQGAKTFSDACKQATLSAEEFKEAIVNAFPPGMITDTIQHNSIRDGLGPPVVIRQEPEPQRTSDPEEIESIFTTPGISQEDLMKIWQSTFEDVTEVSFGRDNQRECKTIKLDFVDGTTQLVEISDIDVQMELLKKIANSKSSTFIQPIVRQCYPSSLFDDPDRID